VNWLKLGATIFVGLILIVGSASIVSFMGDPFGIQQRKTDNAVAEAIKAKGDAATNDAQSNVGIDWSKIAANATTRDSRLATIGTTNAQQIQKAPGANAPLTDGYIAAVNAGLCNYESTPRAGCS
jgi:hypothetical protein